MDLRVNRVFLAFVASVDLVLGGFAWYAIIDATFADVALVGRFGLWLAAIAAPLVLFDLVRFIPPRITVFRGGIRGATPAIRRIDISSDKIRAVELTRSASVDYLLIFENRPSDPIKIPVSVPASTGNLAADVSEILHIVPR